MFLGYSLLQHISSQTHSASILLSDSISFGLHSYVCAESATYQADISIDAAHSYS